MLSAFPPESHRGTAPNVDSLEARQRWACSPILFEEELRLSPVEVASSLAAQKTRAVGQGGA
jgi:hypothetical protein